MLIPEDLLPQYPALRETRTSKGKQCVHWKSYCVECGVRFDRRMSQICQVCSAKRFRCMMWKVKGETCCRVHSRTRHYSIYTAVIGQISDEEYAAVIEGHDERHDQALAVATLALAQASAAYLEGEDKNPERLLRNAKLYFEVVAIHQKINEGELIVIDNSQATLRAWRSRIRDFKRAIFDVLLRHGMPESEAKKILEDVKEATKLHGNRVTVGTRGGEGADVDFSTDPSTVH